MYFLNVVLFCFLTILLQTVKLDPVDCPDIKNVTVKIYESTTRGLMWGEAFREEIISGCIEADKFSSNENLTKISIMCSEQAELNQLGTDYVRNMPDLKHFYIEKCPVNRIDPWAFKNVPKLETVVLHGVNSSVQVLKGDIFNVIPSIEEVSVTNLNVASVEDEAFSNVPELKRVDLSRNKLSFIGKNWFINSTNIDRLRLLFNNIQTIESGVFKQLTNLTSLSLAHNQISRIKVEAFQGLTNLISLNLLNNSIKFIPGDAIKHLSNLNQLYLDDNQITSIKSDTFQGLTALEILSLNKNYFQIIKSDFFKHLPSLMQLYLNGNQITSIEADAFKGLTKLRYLSLDNNRIASISAKLLQELPNLVGFSIKTNELNYLSESFLETTLKNNVELLVYDNPLVCSCLDFIIGWASKNNVTKNLGYKPRYKCEDYPLCVVDEKNTEVCPMIVQPVLTEHYKLNLSQYLSHSGFCSEHWRIFIYKT